jgi:hypothetical protein
MNINTAPRDIRRMVFAQERNERASGRWTPFARRPLDEMRAALGGMPGGWLRQINRVWSNGWLVVLVRTIETTALGLAVEHAAFRTAMQSELSWREKQRMKNEIFGADRMGVEVFPQTADLIDAADMYHLWVFPFGYRFDFGLAEGQQ